LTSPLEAEAALEEGLPGEIKVSPLSMSKFFSSPMGRGMITDLGKILQTDSRFNGGSSIRSALVLSAASPEGRISEKNKISEFLLVCDLSISCPD